MVGLIDGEVWGEFFRALDQCCTDALATVQFQLREQERSPARRQRRLRSIRYDDERDAVELCAGGGEDRSPAVRYFIRSPRQISVEEVYGGSRILIEDRARGMTAIAIDQDGQREGVDSAAHLSRRFSRDLQAEPDPGARSIVARLTMRRHADARSG
jgi:hypothetical protein